MSERNDTLAYALGRANAAYIAEAEIPSLTAAAACPCRVRKERHTPRFWESGWFAAAVSGIVAVGVMAAIVLAGQRNPVSPPVGMNPPAPPVTESEIVETEAEEPIPPYTKGLAYREVSSGFVRVSGIGTATDEAVIHIPPEDERGREVLGIDERAFAGNTSITEVVFSRAPSSGMYTVYTAAFENCTSLERVRVCDKNTGVTLIPGCFEGCGKLSAFDLPPESDRIHLHAASIEGTLWMESQTGEFVILAGILLKYQGSAADVVLPDEVRSIGNGAFDGCHTVSSVTASERSLLKKLGYQAFTGADSLKTVSLPNLEYLEGSAFNGCPDLETVILPRSVQHLLPDPPDNAAVFLYAGTREDWDKITFYTDESKAKWEARTIFENQS